MTKWTWMVLPLLAVLAWSGTATAGGRQPVLVELFTSEGCSSCPPADALLRRLGATQPVGDARIVPLEEHVDYWNALGWRDPYSSARFTRRQRRYAAALDNAGVYTPQMVVNGESGFVGSNAARARRAIAAAAAEPQAIVTLARAGADSPARNAVKLSIGIAAVPALFRGQIAEVWLAVTEDGLASRVTRGENAGRVLHHDAVVRLLRRIETLRLGNRQQTLSATLPLNSGWPRRDLNIVAFVQAQTSRRIVGAAMFPPNGNGAKRSQKH